jgi:hypothetical protein
MADVANLDGMVVVPGVRMTGASWGSYDGQQASARGHELVMTAAAVTDRQARA